MLPALSIEAALGIAGGSLLGALVMLGLWLRARSRAGHILNDLRSLRQHTRREQADLERQIEQARRAMQDATLRIAETEESVDALTARHQQLQDAHTALRAAYLEAMGGATPPSVRLTATTAPIEGTAQAVIEEVGQLAAQAADCRDAIGTCRALMDDLMHDMHRALDLGRTAAAASDASRGFFHGLEEGLVSVETAMREAHDRMETLRGQAARLTQRGGAMAAAAQTHAEAVRELTAQWRQLESATAPASPDPSR